MGNESNLIKSIFRRDFISATTTILACPTEAAVVDNSGWTPLHWACAQSAPPSLVKDLILAWPPALTLHDRYGCTPLHDACLQNRSDVVKVLLASTSEATHMCRNNKGRTPLQHLVWFYDKKIKRVIDSDLSKYKRPSDIIIGEGLTSFWCNAVLLISRILNKDVRQFKSMMHAALALGKQGSTGLVKLILKIDPASRGGLSKEGSMILHLSASSQFGGCRDTIRFLCQEFPKSAQVQDERGRLPLHVAAENGCDFEDGIETMIQAFPSALRTSDPHSELLPFMLASKSGNIDCAFRLLQQCPDLLQSGDTPSKRPASEAQFCSKRRRLEI